MGIPDRLRGMMWKKLADVSMLRDENPNLFMVRSEAMRGPREPMAGISKLVKVAIVVNVVSRGAGCLMVTRGVS